MLSGLSTKWPSHYGVLKGSSLTHLETHFKAGPALGGTCQTMGTSCALCLTSSEAISFFLSGWHKLHPLPPPTNMH